MRASASTAIPHHVRDDAYAPLIGRGTGATNHIFRKYETELFFAEPLDSPNQLGTTGEI